MKYICSFCGNEEPDIVAAKQHRRDCPERPYKRSQE